MTLDCAKLKTEANWDSVPSILHKTLIKFIVYI